MGPVLRRTRTLLAAPAVGLTLLVAVAAGCSDDEPTAAPPTTAPTGGTSAPASGAPSSSGTTERTPPSVPLSIPAPDDGTSAEGSGCAPDSTTELPDGIWFGTVEVTDGALALDLACLFTFEAANVAAAEDGFSEIPVPNDYWIRNQNPLTYPLRLDAGTLTLELAQGGGSIDHLPPVEGPAAATEVVGRIPGFRAWVLVEDGVTTVIQQQFFP